MNDSIEEVPPKESDLAGKALRLCVRGLRATERALLVSVVRLSQRARNRSLLLELVEAAHGREADVLLIDARDPDAMAWARQQTWLGDKPVLWLDATAVPPMHMLARRPLQWPMLPVLLARVIDHFSHSSQPAGLPAIVSPAPAATRVLVVDDSEVVRNQVRGGLERLGFPVGEAAGVEAAITAAKATAIDCVFMDVVMPGVDGYEGCREMKRLQRTRPLPVVMLTSKSSPFDRIRGRMAGCDAYLAKPVHEQELKEVLARVLAPQLERAPQGFAPMVVPAT